MIFDDLKGAARTAVVAGSGLSPRRWPGKVAASIPYGEIGGLGATSVEGHPGRLLLIETAGGPILVFAGRRHLYEGGGLESAGAIPRAASHLGCRAIVLTQAAGSLTPSLPVGSWLLPSAVVALPWREASGESPAISESLRARVAAAAADAGIALRDGQLYWTAGPAYETPAEASMAALMGASAATMSPLPELLAASEKGLEAVCLSYITNFAPNVGEGHTGHEMVLEAGKRGSRGVLSLLPELAKI
jgi:purine-nucleoside phosphorylase